MLVCTLTSHGCRTVAEAPPADTQHAATLAVVGSNGRNHERSVGTIAAGDDEKELLKHHLRYMARQTGPALVADNDVKLLIDGPQTYDAIFTSLAAAQRTIDIEVYILDDDHIGRALADLLEKKQRGGVRVRVIYDSVGSIKTPRAFFDELRSAGVEVLEFNPVNPLGGKISELNNRDHRKMTIVDNKVAYTGGINISSVYAHGSGFSRKSRREADEKTALKGGWRDTQIQVTGPAVQIFSDMFEAMWLRNGGSDRAAGAKLENPQPRGDKYLRVIGSSPDDKTNFIYTDLLKAAENARRSVHITMSYFSPDAKMIEALCGAARRGVEVELVLPGFSDWWPVLEAGRSHYSKLLAAGVVIYERKDVFLHAKTAVIDRVWSTVGSSNMDMRSFLHNHEVNAVVLGNDFGEEMEAMFAADRARATLVDAETWRKRSLPLRLKQAIARIFAYWL